MSDTGNKAAVTVVPIESLIPDSANIRRRDERAKRSLSASLRQFGAARSIVLDSKDIVRAGNGTLEAAQDAGCTEVLVVEPRPGQLVAVKRSDWSATEATGYSIADNRIGDLASFDDSALAETLRSLQSEDFSLDAVGFTDDEVDKLIERLGDSLLGESGDDGGKAEQTPEPKIDQAAELQAKWQTAAGQLWIIPSSATPGGEHRMLCGDSTKAENVARVMGGEKAQGVFTSPPYAEQRKGQYQGTPADQYLSWWDWIQANVRSILANDGSFFVNIKAHCEDGERSLYVMDLVLAMKRQWDWRYVDEFCWKRQSCPGSWPNRFKNQFEPVHQFSLDHKIKFCPHNVTHDSDDTFVSGSKKTKSAAGFNHGVHGIDGLALPGNVIDIHVETRLSKLHEAPFPVGLPVFFHKAFSDPGDTWFEPFCGSGTSIVAAEQTRRLCRGIELAPKYVAVILERLTDMGLEPRLAR